MLRRLPRVTKMNIKSTKRGCYQGCMQIPVMDFLSQLESLKMCFDRKVFHTCQFSFPSTLKKLTLSEFCRPWSEISLIGMLPHLEVLKLLANAFVGPTWDVEDEQFLNLKYLKLNELDIVEWNAPIDSFPRLEGLLVDCCFQLKEIPSTFGDICTLKIIELHGCFMAESSAIIILEEQQDMGNEGLQVLIKDGSLSWMKRFMKDQESQGLPIPHRGAIAGTIDSFLDAIPGTILSVWNPWEKYVQRKVCHQDIFTYSTIHDCVKKSDCTNVESKRRTNIRCKYNCQPRRAIVARHLHQGLK